MRELIMILDIFSSNGFLNFVVKRHSFLICSEEILVHNCVKTFSQMHLSFFVNNAAFFDFYIYKVKWEISRVDEVIQIKTGLF